MRATALTLAVVAVLVGVWLAGARGPCGTAAAAQPAPAGGPAADEPAPTEIVADIDGDGMPDRVWVTVEKGRTVADRRVYIEADVGAVHAKAGPYEALGLAKPVAVRRLPSELDALQRLPRTSLGVADANLDRKQDVVVRLSVPRSGNTNSTVILTWDAKEPGLRTIWESEEEALLLMDVTGSGPTALVSFEVLPRDVPVARRISVWNGEQFVPAEPALPHALAEALLPLYRVGWMDLGLYDGPSVLEGCTGAAIGVGTPSIAVDRLTVALAEAEEAERAAQTARARLLHSMSVAQAAAGDEHAAKANLTEAEAAARGGVRPSETDVALGMASVYAAIGHREKALWWIDRAAELDETPGAFQQQRKYLTTVPMLTEAEKK